MSESVLVAVYGSLLEGLHNHGVMERSEGALVDTAWLPGWAMFAVSSYPAIVRSDRKEDTILVELYRVPEKNMGWLDALEGYRGEDPKRNFYHRTLVPTDHGDAWIYYWHNESVDSMKGGYRRVPMGDWRAFIGADREGL